MKIKAEAALEFIFEYAKQYRAAYQRATKSPPDGPGYPNLICSPFLTDASFEIYIALDGVLINHIDTTPDPYRFLIGGPALKVDLEPTKTTSQMAERLRQGAILRKSNGICRIVAEKPMQQRVWNGRIRGISRQLEKKDLELGIVLRVHEVETSLADLVNSFTFDAFGDILNIHLPSSNAPVGQARIIERMGIFTADLKQKRFLSHLEIHSHSDDAAWDKRFISLRVQNDLKRDLASILADPMHERGGLISFGSAPEWLNVYSNRLEHLGAGINALRAALQDRSDDVEAVFHEVLEKHPLLLDIYGTSQSKPRFNYPVGTTSPIGKIALEPDFLITYPDCSYKLIEIERPAKHVATVTGHPRAEVTQAMFQCAEWKHFIKTHYQTLIASYPEIHTRCKTAVIMSRASQLSFKNITDIAAYKGLMREQFNVDEFFTYDDLYDRAKAAYLLLAGLHPI